MSGAQTPSLSEDQWRALEWLPPNRVPRLVSIDALHELAARGLAAVTPDGCGGFACKATPAGLALRAARVAGNSR